MKDIKNKMISNSKRSVAFFLCLSLVLLSLTKEVRADGVIDNDNYEKVLISDAPDQVAKTLKSVDIEKHINYANNSIRWKLTYNKNHENMGGWVYLGIPKHKTISEITIGRKPQGGSARYEAVYANFLETKFEKKDFSSPGFRSDYDLIKGFHRDATGDQIKVSSDINWWGDTGRIGSILVMTTNGGKGDDTRRNSDMVTFEFTTTHEPNPVDFKEGLDFLPAFIAVGERKRVGPKKIGWPRIAFLGPFGKKGQHNLQMPDPIVVNDKTKLTPSDKNQLIASMLQKTGDYYFKSKLEDAYEDLEWLKKQKSGGKYSNIEVEDNGFIRVTWQDKTQSVRGDIHNFVIENKAPTIMLTNENQTIEYGKPIQPVEIIASDEDTKRGRGKGALLSPNGQNFKVVKLEGGKYVDTNLPAGLRLEDKDSVGAGNKILTGTPTELDFSKQERHTLTITVVATDDMGKQSDPKTITITVTKPLKPDITKDLAEIRQKADEKQNLIDADNDLTNKQDLKDKVAEALRKAEEALNKAQTVEEVAKAKIAFEDELAKIDEEITKQKALKKAKEDAVNEIETAKRAKLADIQKKYDDKVITAEEKKKYEDEITAKVDSAIREINSSNDLDEINNKKDETIRDITGLQISGTKKNEALSALEAHKNKLQKEIDKIKNQEEKAKRQQELNSAYEAGKKAINNATTDAKVDSALDAAKAEMDKVIKKKEAIEAINAARIKKLGEIEKEKTKLTEKEKQDYDKEVNKLADDAIESINDGTATDIEQKKTETVKAIEAVKPLAKQKAIDEINEALAKKLEKVENKKETLTEEEYKEKVDNLNQIAKTAIENIKKTTEQGNIDTTKTTAIDDITKANIAAVKKPTALDELKKHKEAKQAEIEKLKDEAEKTKRQAELEKAYTEGVKAINEASSNANVDTALNNAKDLMDKIVKKALAVKEIEEARKQKLTEIKDAENILSEQEKKDYEDEVNKLADDAIKAINDGTATNIEQKKTETVRQINAVKPLARDKAIDAITSAKDNKLNKINEAFNSGKITTEEKDKYIKTATDLATEAIGKIKVATDQNSINQIKTDTVSKLENYDDIVGTKKDEAKRAVLDHAQTKKDEIAKIVGLSPEEIKRRQDEVDAAANQAIAEIDKNTTNTDSLVEQAKNKGISDINKVIAIQKAIDDIEAYKKQKQADIDTKKKELTPDERMERKKLVAEEANKTIEAIKKVADEMEINPLVTKVKAKIDEIVNNENTYKKELEDEINRAREAKKQNVQDDDKLSENEKNKYKNEIDRIADEEIARLKDDETSPKNTLKNQVDTVIDKISNFQTPGKDLAKEKINEALRTKLSLVTGEQTKDLTLTIEEREEQKTELNRLSGAANQEIEAAKTQAEIEEIIKKYTDKDTGLITANTKEGVKKPEATQEINRKAEELKNNLKTSYPSLDEKYLEELSSLATQAQEDINKTDLTNDQVEAKKNLTIKSLEEIKAILDALGKKLKEIAEKAESNKISTEGDNSEKAKYEKEAKKLAEETIEAIKELSKTASDEISADKDNFEANLAGKKTEIETKKTETLTAIKKIKVISLDIPKNKIKAAKKKKQKEIEDDKTKLTTDEKDKLLEKLANKEQEALATLDKLAKDNENQLDTETDKIQEAINSSTDTSIKTIEAIKIEDHAKNKQEAINELQVEKEKVTAEIEEEFKQKYPNLDEKYVRKYQEEIAIILEKASKEITEGENLSNARVTAKKDLAKKKMAGVKNLAFVTGAKLQVIVDDIRLTIEEKEAEQEKVNKIAEDAFSQIKKLSVENQDELASVVGEVEKIQNEAKKAIDEYQVTPVQKPEAIKNIDAESNTKLMEIAEKFAAGIISEAEKSAYEELVNNLVDKALGEIREAENINNADLKAAKEETIENIRNITVLGKEKPIKAIEDALAAKTQAIESNNDFTTEEKHEHIERLTGLAKEAIKTITDVQVEKDKSLEDTQKVIDELKDKTIAEINKEIEPRHKPAKIKELEEFSNKFIAEKIEAKDTLSDSEKAKYSQQVKDIVAKYTAKINDTGEEINLAGLEELLRQAKAEIEGLNLTARDKSKDEIDNYAKGYISFINRELNHLSLTEQEGFIKRIEEIADFYKKLIDKAMSDEEVLELLKKAIEAMKKTIIDAGLLNDIRKPDLPSLADENKKADKKLKDRQPKTGVKDGQFGIATMVLGLALALIMSRRKLD